MVNSTGREQEYYARTTKGIGHAYDFSEHSHKQQCFTDHRDDISMGAEFGSTSQKNANNYSPGFAHLQETHPQFSTLRISENSAKANRPNNII
jgi:hypothetical protein